MSNVYGFRGKKISPEDEFRNRIAKSTMEMLLAEADQPLAEPKEEAIPSSFRIMQVTVFTNQSYRVGMLLPFDRTRQKIINSYQLGNVYKANFGVKKK